MPRSTPPAGPPRGGSAFDRHALSYDAVWGGDPVAEAMRAEVWRTCEAVFPPGGRILDAGCGVGIDAAWLLSTGRRVVAADASAGMLRAAAARAPGAELHCASLEALDAHLTGPFDGALLDFGVLNCVEPAHAARALAPLLSPGAAVVLVPMPRVAPTWMLSRLLRGEPFVAARRLRRVVDVPMEGESVRTRYICAREVAAAFAPWFALEEQAGMGFLLPPPGSDAPASLTRWMDALEAPLRRLPGLRSMGDHLLMVLRRTATPAAAGAGLGARRSGPVTRRRATALARRTGQVRDLRAIVFTVTTGCQSACLTCDHRGPAGGEALDAAAVGRLTAEARSMGCRDALFTGGEPLLRPDIARLMAAARLAGLRVVLLTNGLALARRAADVARWCDEVVLSLDGYDNVSYLRIRGVDGFDAVGRGVAALRAQAPGIRVTARVTVSAHNAGSLARIGRAAASLGLDGVSFLAVDSGSSDAFGRAGPAALAPPDPDALRAELAALRGALPPGFVLDSAAALDRVWQKLAADAGLRPHHPPACDAPWTSVVVEPDLRLRPCFFLPSASHARAGLRAGLAAAAPALAAIDVARDPACARCVCWAKLT